MVSSWDAVVVRVRCPRTAQIDVGNSQKALIPFGIPKFLGEVIQVSLRIFSYLAIAGTGERFSRDKLLPKFPCVYALFGSPWFFQNLAFEFSETEGIFQVRWDVVRYSVPPRSHQRGTNRHRLDVSCKPFLPGEDAIFDFNIN